MKTRFLSFFLMVSLLVFPLNHVGKEVKGSDTFLGKDFVGQGSPRVILPLYVRLQVSERSNITLWESIPQSFSDHVATIDTDVLAMFVSFNSKSLSLSRDKVGNLWMVTNYTLNAGDYISTLGWVSSKTLSENLASLGSAPFPQVYPEEVQAYLEHGRKILARNQTIQEVAADYNQTRNNMTQTVKDVLDFVNTQGYDRDKTRLLLSGGLNTTDMLDVFKDAVQVHATNSSICLERSWYAAAILRALGVPTRTVTDVRLKTWIQVWLPNVGWVDAETLCVEPPPRVGMLPKSISTSVPWMIENSSDASFPFTWLPNVPVRVANLTFEQVGLFDVNQFRTVLSKPIEADLFKQDPAKFKFPILVEPEIIYGSLTLDGSDLTFSLFRADENASEVLTLGEYNSVILGDTSVTFKPVPREGFLVLQDFSVQQVGKFDFRLLVLIVGLPVVLMVVLLYWRMRKPSR